VLKVMTIVGTRPELIRLSRILEKLDSFCKHVFVHTGQNYDYELNEVFFKDLSIRKPDYYLGVGGGSLGEALGKILIETERVLIAEKPDAVLILGDTNSAISAIIARRMKIPIYHMEAGNRSFDKNVPEETNRKIVDHIADFNLVYTEHARRHLLSEGISHRRIYLSGSPMREVLDYYRPQIDSSMILSQLGLEKGKYFVVSLHREENVDSLSRLSTLQSTLNTLADAYGFPLIVSTHPRTRMRLDALKDAVLNPLVNYMKPFGFHDYNRLQMDSYCCISDSGTIAEEASLLDFPAVTPRESIERPEAMDVGSVVISGIDTDTILRCVKLVTSQSKKRKSNGSPNPTPSDYQVTNTSDRVVTLIVGTAKLSNQWDGIRNRDSG
jgi:UDP-N-acetyl-L-fucosamine synthase